MNTIKKITAYVLIALIIISTIIGLLAIWEIIEVEDIMKKTLTSIFVIFIASVVSLFIFSSLHKDENKK